MNTDISTLEVVIGWVLRIGTTVSGTMLAAGLLLSFLLPGHAVTRGLLTGGTLILLLTPTARVALSFVDYILARDWWFVMWTGVVLALLASGFIAAFS